MQKQEQARPVTTAKKRPLESPGDLLVRVFSKRGHHLRDERVLQQTHRRWDVTQRLNTHGAGIR